jgi:outer membrane lipoprotein SlyB
MTKSIAVLSILLIGAVAFSACETAPQTGALVGAVTGGALGAAAAGGHHGHHGGDALAGAALGAVAGGAIGYVAGKIYEEGQTTVYAVQNSNGSVTPVRVIHRGAGYVGPQGEVYPTPPTYEQIAQRYAR